MSLRATFQKSLARVLIAAPIVLGSCNNPKEYAPQKFTGEVIEGECDPSVLGSGDHYYVTLKNDETVKRLTFYWPEASEMCNTLSKQPNIGDIWTIETTISSRNPNRSTLSFEHDFTIVEVQPAEPDQP